MKTVDFDRLKVSGNKDCGNGRAGMGKREWGLGMGTVNFPPAERRGTRGQGLVISHAQCSLRYKQDKRSCRAVTLG